MRHSGVARQGPEARLLRGGRGARLLPVGWLCVLFVPFGCATARGGGADADPSVLEAPPIREGLRDPNEARQTALLLTEGEGLLGQGLFEAARERAREVEGRYPEAVGSSLALWLDSRASAALEDWGAANAAVERYVALVGSEGPHISPALLLRASSRWRAGAPGAVEALFQLPVDADPEVLARADSVATAMGRLMEMPALRELIADAPRHPRILPAFLVELAVRRHLAGAEAEARELAQEALALAPGGQVAARATGVVEGRVDEEIEVSGVLGAIVSGSGSPSLQQLSQEIQEGIEVALAAERRNGSLPVRFIPVPDEGDPSQVSDAIEGFEGQGALGVVGPLLAPLVEAAARARVGALPIISPTARTVPLGAEGVFTLTGIDPEAGRALARLALSEGVRQVVVLHPGSEEMYEEARWFRQAFEEAGGFVSRTLTYPAGTTGFGPQLEEVVRLAPPGLVVLLPPGGQDLELLAPQLAFYGVRELEGLLVFGNESWTSDEALQAVQTRHTEGVFAVTSWDQEGEFGPGWEEFVTTYEEHFQRTLRSATPALGYDAVRLLLAGARLGGGSPAGTLRGLEEVQGFRGATGIFSFRAGRIVRDYFPVRVEGRRLVPLSPLPDPR